MSLVNPINYLLITFHCIQLFDIKTTKYRGNTLHNYNFTYTHI